MRERHQLLVFKVQMRVMECGGRRAACLASGSNAVLNDAQNASRLAKKSLTSSHA